MGATPHFAAQATADRRLKVSERPRVRNTEQPPWPEAVRAAIDATTAKEARVATIVCAVDDSPGAIEALRVAGALSAGFDVRLVLAHAAGGWAGPGGESLSMAQALEGGRRLVARVAREHELKAEQRVEVGEPA